MRIEWVVEEFINLVSEEKFQQAGELIIKESQGRENNLAYWLFLIGIENEESGNHLQALHCFQIAEEIVKLRSIKREIVFHLPWTHTKYANLLLGMRRFEEAEKHYKRSIEINPERAIFYSNYAVSLYNMKKYKQAEEHFRKALDLDSELLEAHINYALLLLGMRRFEEAEKHYKRSIEINPEMAISYSNYALLLIRMRRFEEAEEQCKKAVGINPEFVEAHINYALSLICVKRFEEAEKHYKRAIEINPEYTDAHTNYANLLGNLERFEEAEKHYKRAIEINPERAVAHYDYAAFLVTLERFEEAEKHYKRAIEINPEYAEAHNNYANLLGNLERFEEAEKHYKRAIEINPERAIFYSNYAVLLCNMEKFKEAKRHCRKAIDLNPEFADPHYIYAFLLVTLERFEEAEKHYKRSIEINPELLEAYINYANLLLHMGRFEEAEKHYKRAIEINPESADAHNNYAVLLDNLERFEEAEMHYKRAIEINPEYADACSNLGMLHFKMNELNRARSCFENAKDIFEKRGRGSDTIKMEAFSNWALARELWENFSSSDRMTFHNLAESKEYYLQAALRFKEIGLFRVSIILDIMSKAIFISKNFLFSLHSKSLADLRIKIAEVYEEFLPIYEIIEEISSPDTDLVEAQFICIDTLKKCLNFEEIDTANLQEARQIFSNYDFTEPFEATTALENFLYKIKKYRSLKEIPKQEEAKLLRMVLPFSAFDNLIFKRIDKLARSRYARPYIIEELLRKMMKKEITPVIRDSEERIVGEIRSSEIRITKQIQECQSELLGEIAALDDAQFICFKKLISRIIKEEIKNIKGNKMKKNSEERFGTWRRAFYMSKDVLSVFADIISIYIFLRAGNSEEAMKQALSTISVALSKIRAEENPRIF